VLPGDNGGVVLPDGSAVLSGAELGLVPGAVFGPGVVVSVDVPDGVVLAGEVTPVKGVPPGQRELSGKRSHKMRLASFESFISGGALLVWATAILLASARVRAVPMQARYLTFIMLNLIEVTGH
jgi:hypothetical protein